MTPHLAVDGRVGLRLPDRSRLDTYLSWENDAATIIGFGSQFPQALSVRDAGWDSQQRNPTYQKFEAVVVADDTPIGMTTLAVDPVVRTAEFMMVVDPDRRGEGFGVEAARATLVVAFEIASLEMVWAKVLEPNVASLRLAQSAGLRRTGWLESAGWWRGRRCSEVLLCLTRERYLRDRPSAGAGPDPVRAG